MARQGHHLAAVTTLIMVDCYLRPGEMLGLRPSSFLGPIAHASRHWVALLFPQEDAMRSKVGAADDTILFDSRRTQWMGPLLEVLSKRKPRDEPVMRMTYSQYLSIFRSAATNVGVDAVPYQGRHSGASLDRGEDARSLNSVQKRGRWASSKSVKRYEKAGLLNRSWTVLNPATKAHCEPCLHMIGDVLLRGVAPPVPPATALRAVGVIR